MELPKLKKANTKKKKILLLADDIRVHSGVGTMARAIVDGTIHKYDWVQIGGAVNHPDLGKIIDVSDEYNKALSTNDCYCKIYPVNGYGNPTILRQLIDGERPDAILHFTDPRFFQWLYQMEHEIRQQIPIFYYNIWDDLPYPHWNENFYESCDLLMAISKQTYNINNQVCQRKKREEGVDLTYVPHGVNHTIFSPLEDLDGRMIQIKETLFPGQDPEFIAFFNSRNIGRKRPADLIQGFKMFCSELPKEKADKCYLVLHTTPVDDNGTDLPAVAEAIAPECNIVFSGGKVTAQHLNILYNIADVTCQPSSAEGFGLSIMESIMAGTPILASCIGGLQDQMGFTKDDGTPLELSDYKADWPSNSDGKYKSFGSWAYPLWPQMNLAGSPLTPYIYDSRVSTKSIKEGLRYWYEIGREERKRRGSIGRDWAIQNGFTTGDMVNSMMESMETCWKTWEPRKKFTIINTNRKKIEYPIGVIA